jgi:hypothetical protein
MIIFLLEIDCVKVLMNCTSQNYLNNIMKYFKGFNTKYINNQYLVNGC